jgi:hypothetical protein
MKHIVEVDNLLDGVRRPGLLPVPESGVRDEDLLSRIGKDEFIIKFDPANLFIGEDAPIEVWLLDIQQGKELYGVLALERSLLSCDGHLFSLLSLKLFIVNA